ncbi:MAG: AAA family ATPase [Nitrospirae bacterium]|nr:AAA family ATPase [Nitrospirota bacterium]
MKGRHKIIFVGGVHGVGKTTLCASLCSKFGIEHYSASDLISKIKQVKFSSKRTSDIERNQDILITALDEFTGYDKYFLLDGHFVLIDNKDNIIRIPYSTYAAMSPAAIVLLNDTPEAIFLRLKERDKEKITVEQLRALQEEEIGYSKEVASALAIPYLLTNPLTEIELISDFVDKLLAEGGVK